VIYIYIQDRASEASIDIPSEFGPALRSAVNEMRNELGERAAGAYQYQKEDALTRAIAAVGALAAAINQVIPKEDPDYE